jgi:hypothetical protein
MAEVDGAVGVGQGVGDEDFAVGHSDTHSVLTGRTVKNGRTRCNSYL